MHPTVNTTTLSTCILLYRFPQIHPITSVVMLPPLRRMICTGTLILKSNAWLFSKLTEKNSAICINHR